MKVLNSDILASSSPDLFNFTNGIDVDQLLYKHEIRVQLEWIDALVLANLIDSNEGKKIASVLEKAQSLMSSEKFDWSIEDEDIHMNLERYVVNECGDIGKKIHLGRSRNDLIATTFRLYVHECLSLIYELINKLGVSIKIKSLEWVDVIVPGLTHLQFGQPVRLGHIFSAHGFALLRDRDRLVSSMNECLSYCPMGAAAFSGTHLPIDLKRLSNNLGFASPLLHSYDAVGDRDFVLNALNTFSLLATHLTRLAEEIMYYCSTSMGILRLSNQYSTGSSIMPNKRNPDVPELIRAKMARVTSCASEALMIVRGVVPSYGSDLSELKRTFVLAYKELATSLNIFSSFVEELSCNTIIAEKRLLQGHLLATDIANQLCLSGYSFRDAYNRTALLVNESDNLGLQIHELARKKMNIDIDFKNSVEKRNNQGGVSRKTTVCSINQLSFIVE